MVSNSLKITEAALVADLERIRAAHAGDPGYQALRVTLPEDWPI